MQNTLNKVPDRLFPLRDIEELESLLQSSSRILITTHRKPDGDALGSSLGLLHYLRSRGLDAAVVSPTDFDHFLSWMPAAEEVIDAIAKPHLAKKLAEEADLIFCLDFSGLGRLEKYQQPVEESTAKKVLIDHHIAPEDFADLMFHREGFSSTAELVYRVIDELGHRDHIKKDIATCLYTGIMTDTGSFRFSSTTASVHRIASELLSEGVDVGEIHRLVFDNFSENRLRFLGYVLNEKMVVLPEYNTSYMAISKADTEKFNLSPGDTEGLVNYNLSMRGINFGVLMKEGEGKIKISFRSQGKFKCNEFAAHFKGGGHMNASGGRSFDSLDKTVDRFLELLKSYKSELDY